MITETTCRKKTETEKKPQSSPDIREISPKSSEITAAYRHVRLA